MYTAALSRAGKLACIFLGYIAGNQDTVEVSTICTSLQSPEEELWHTLLASRDNGQMYLKKMNAARDLQAVLGRGMGWKGIRVASHSIEGPGPFTGFLTRSYRQASTAIRRNVEQRLLEACMHGHQCAQVCHAGW